MAKKKSRSANVVRKREKRNRDRKTRSKQLAAGKQRKQSYGKMDEERLRTCLMKSRDFLNEPEFEEVHFDINMLFEEMVALLTDPIEDETFVTQINVEPKIIGVESEIPYLVDDEVSKFDEICEKFRTIVLRRLITPKFIRTLQSALAACEKRFKQIGERERAEVAYVTHTLFEVMPQHIMIDHPLIVDIGMKTMQYLVDAPAYMMMGNSNVKGIVSSMLETETVEYEEGEVSNSISDAFVQKPTYLDVKVLPQPSITILTTESNVPTPESNSLPSPDTLPAKALYKNFDGMAIKNVLKEWLNDSLENESETQLDLYIEDKDLYITITENRIQLHAQSVEKLDIAMELLEEYCQSGVMFLAKTIEEGGNVDAPE